jgi:hypothetical protein
MTQSQFLMACNEVNVLPELALDNELIVEALLNKDDTLVIELLNDQF